MKSRRSGVKAVLAKNVGVDPKKLGLMGHSWGGYETAFIVTQTNLFAAANAGAVTPLCAAAAQLYALYEAQGGGGKVFCGVIQLLAGKE